MNRAAPIPKSHAACRTRLPWNDQDIAVAAVNLEHEASPIGDSAFDVDRGYRAAFEDPANEDLVRRGHRDRFAGLVILICLRCVATILDTSWNSPRQKHSASIKWPPGMVIKVAPVVRSAR